MQPGRARPDRPRGEENLVDSYVASALYARSLHEFRSLTVPRIGITPTINIANPNNAAFPARQLTDIGGEFPAWSGDGRSVHWSLGNAHFVYDLDAAEAFEDSVAAAEEEEAEEEEAEAEVKNEDEDEREGEYRAAEFRVLIDAPRDIPEGMACCGSGARSP